MREAHTRAKGRKMQWPLVWHSTLRSVEARYESILESNQRAAVVENSQMRDALVRARFTIQELEQALAAARYPRPGAGKVLTHGQVRARSPGSGSRSAPDAHDAATNDGGAGGPAHAGKGNRSTPAHT